ncbi:DUF4337 family protein [Crenobacter cavernae]|uniref:DUF4337 family protein n=1 Tax=Crenobacter cavernae TaxID=2290923 RepID=A0ABY0FFP7_9NEIS|nr:DUF4337 family protein [Crenobacter cavernae]RXZ43787.1 DUF4337 family protein [Crenobacter cavernae]
MSRAAGSRRQRKRAPSRRPFCVCGPARLRIHARPFGVAVIFLQIAILISSIAGRFKKKPVWLAAPPLAAVGPVYSADGFLPLCRAAGTPGPKITCFVF